MIVCIGTMMSISNIGIIRSDITFKVMRIAIMITIVNKKQTTPT
jgi:hypothetical protein